MIDESRLYDKRTLGLFYGKQTKGFPSELVMRTQNKLKLIFTAAYLEDLSVPPGNRLEALKGDRKGQWSIRINVQWRICFVWDGSKATRIEVVDYHA